jgi:hypothetical protein
MMMFEKEQLIDTLPIENGMGWFIEKYKNKFYVSLLLVDEYGYRKEPLGTGQARDLSTAMGIAWADWQGGLK